MQKGLAEVLRSSFPQKIVWQNRVRISSRHTARILGGQNPEKKHPFHFQKKFHPRQIRNARSVFLSGLPPSPRGGGGAIRRAYDLGQSHHALRAWHISRNSAGSKSELFGIMTTKFDLPKNLIKISDLNCFFLGERKFFMMKMRRNGDSHAP